MNQKNITIAVFIILIVAIGGYLVLHKQYTEVTPTPSPTTETSSIQYTNSQYGFNFTLPSTWQGYSVLTENWQGKTETGQNVTGPEIVIRHPLWTAADPRQDIPVLVFTPSQWTLIQQEKLSLGAAPIGPSELGHNATYVFALPARYNFAFQTGYQEVQQIIEGNPLKAF